ncbi:MAG TPA: hypothetical protein VFU74_06425 [Actinocrinis sp.]|nr:hypothetical protein [Actinocrinis sp.]
MEPGDEAWLCRRGDMELSKYLDQLIRHDPNPEQALAAWIADESTLGPGATAFWGDSWYCPADGSRMGDSAGLVGCPTCGRQLPSRMMCMLVEHQPHLPVPLEGGA